MATTGRAAAAVDVREVGGVEQGRVLVAAVLSMGAGMVHLALAPDHLTHWWVFGWFFIAVGLFQVGYSVVVLRRPTWLVSMVGIVVNVAVILTYVASRTVGLPVQPPEGSVHPGSEAGHGSAGHGHSSAGSGEGVGYTEAVGALDLVTVAAELVLIGLLVNLLPGRLRGVTCNVLLLLGVALWGLRISGALS